MLDSARLSADAGDAADAIATGDADDAADAVAGGDAGAGLVFWRFDGGGPPSACDRIDVSGNARLETDRDTPGVKSVAKCTADDRLYSITRQPYNPTSLQVLKGEDTKTDGAT